MQNLLLSKLASATLGLLVSWETVWLRGDFCLVLPDVLTVIAIEITIAVKISVNKTGSFEIKLSEIGATGKIVGLGSVDEAVWTFGTYCSFTSIG